MRTGRMMNNEIGRRRVLRGAAVAVSCALLGAGCSAEPTPQGVPESLAMRDDTTVLTMWSIDGTGHDLLIADFERQNPGVTVDLRISSFDQHHEGLRTTFEVGGSVPDLAVIERGYLPSFVAKPENFVDLRTMDVEGLADEYLDWRWDEGVAATGEVVGLPTDVGGLAIAYRSDIFEAAGLASAPDDVAAMASTWDGLVEAGIALRSAGIDVPFVDSPNSIFLARLGQESIGYVHRDGQAALDEGGVRDAWDLAMRVIDEDLSAGFAQFSPEWNDAMANGRFVAMAAPSWMRSYLARVAPDTATRWRLAPIPGVAGNWGGSQVTVPAGGENPELAAELAKFLTSPESQLALFQESGNFPSAVSLHDLPEISELSDPYFGGQTVGSIYVASVQEFAAQPADPHQRELEQIFTSAIRAVEDGADPETQWRAAVAEGEQLISSH